MNFTNKDVQEMIEAFTILLDNKFKNVAQINKCICKQIVNNNKCVVEMNGKINQVTYYGNQPTINSTYPIFIPGNNMSVAFIIVP